MTRLAAVALALLVLPVAAEGASRPTDGCPAPCSGQSSSPDGSKLLFVQPRGETGPVRAYDTGSGRVAFGLPAGRSSADGRFHVQARLAGTRTLLVRYRLLDGARLGTLPVPGRWTLGGVSPNGRWLALSRRSAERTSLRLVDAIRSRTAPTIVLRGDFEVETVSADGRRVFLIQRLGERSALHYLVRVFDVPQGRLRRDPIRPQGEEDEPMTGYAWSAVGSPDGRRLLTLYLDVRRSTAFVHALDLGRSTAACIDLPSAGPFAALKRYALTLSPDGRTLYAANATLGAIAEIDLAGRRVRRTVRFAGRATPAAPRAATLSGTISRDGRTLYFTGGSDLWAYDAAYGVVRGPYRTEGRVVGFGFGARDRTVHALRSDGRMLAFAAATGERLG